MFELHMLYSILFIALGGFAGFVYYKIHTNNLLGKLGRVLYFFGVGIAFSFILLQYISDCSYRQSCMDWGRNFHSKIFTFQSTYDIDVAIKNSSEAYSYLMSRTNGVGLCSIRYHSSQDISVYAGRLEGVISHLKLLKKNYPRAATDLGLVKFSNLHNYYCPNLELNNSLFMQIGIGGGYLCLGLVFACIVCILCLANFK